MIPKRKTSKNIDPYSSSGEINITPRVGEGVKQTTWESCGYAFDLNDAILNEYLVGGALEVSVDAFRFSPKWNLKLCQTTDYLKNVEKFRLKVLATSIIKLNLLQVFNLVVTFL